MTIGEDLHIMLGLVPTRDRAGIQRGTLATEVAAQTDGPRPPSFTLPTATMTGAPRPDLDVETTGSTGGPSAAPPPAPRERVVAASPAAAASPAVMRNSDIILAQMERQMRQARMNQAISAIALIANGLFNRNPDSAVSTRQALAGGLAGGGGPDTNTLKQLLEMRDKEDSKEREIQDAMQTQGLSRDRATVLVEQDAYKARNAPTELRAAEDIRTKEQQKIRLRPQAAKIAAMRGTDVETIRNLIETDPNAVEKLTEAEALTDLENKQITGQTGKLGNIQKAADLKSAFGFDTDLEEFVKANPDLTVQELLQYRQLGPTARLELQKERGKKLGELSSDESTKLTNFDKMYFEKVQPKILESEGVLRQQADAWFEGLRTGSPLSEQMLNLSKIWSKATGQPLPKDAQATEQFILGQGKLAASGIKQYGANPSNIDLEMNKLITGGAAVTPKTVKAILYFREKENNQAIEQHRKDVAQVGGRVAKKAMEARHPPPTRVMRDVVEENFPGFIKDIVSRGLHTDPKNKTRFEEQIGPGVYDQLVAEELAKKKG